MIDIFREDDNDKSDDEDERIEFSTNKEAIERQRMKDNFLAAEHGEYFSKWLPSILDTKFICQNTWISGDKNI